MKIRQSIKMALSAIWANKMRSFLTMLGIIIGVLSVTLLISIVQSGTGTITDSMNGLGGNLLTVQISDPTQKLTYSELKKLDEKKEIRSTAPYVNGQGIAKANGNSEKVSVIGIDADYNDAKELKLEAGSLLTETDRANRLKVCIVGAKIAEKLFETTNIVGKTVRINGSDYRIKGVLEKEDEASINNSNSTIYIPLSNAQRMFSQTGIYTFYATAMSEKEMKKTQTVTEDFLFQKFQDEDSYTVLNMADVLDMLDTVLGTLSLMLGGIAGISLLVGGIGIMNIMLVSVTERTREIGIRKAIGAQRSDITIQFMIESIFISLVGGIIGMVLSQVALSVLNIFVDSVHFTIAPSVAMLALGFSVAVGLIFGIYPANKAAKLKPINALRYE